MNWLFPKGSGPPLNSLQKLRQKQIESLKTAHPTVLEIQKDVEYRIPFTVNTCTCISLNIVLPPQFPQEKPSVTVFPPVAHHLVENGTVVNSPLLNNFVMHTDLGKMIQSLLDEFRKSPPVVMSGAPAFPFMYQSSAMSPYPAQNFHFVPPFPAQDAQRPAVPSSLPQPGVEPQQVVPRPPAPAYGLITDLPLPVPTADLQTGLNGHMYKMPEIPDSFTELSEMSVSQLKDMSDKEEVMLEYFACLPQLKQITSDKEDLVNSIVTMAKKNLQLEPQLEEKRQEMLCKFDQLTQMLSAFHTKMQRQHELSESCSLSALQARLKVAAHQAEEESDETAENFLEGKAEIDDFLTSFMEKRTLSHSRRAKEEKLQQSINTHGQFPPSH